MHLDIWIITIHNCVHMYMYGALCTSLLSLLCGADRTCSMQMYVNTQTLRNKDRQEASLHKHEFRDGFFTKEK